jgi:signal transduction histidine kinase
MVGAVLTKAEGLVLEQTRSREGDALLLQAGTRTIRALLVSTGQGTDHLPALQEGSRVSVTGVSHARAGEELFAGEERVSPMGGASLQLWLQNPADAVLLERAPWWTWRKASVVLTLFACALLAALGWVRMLRRSVVQRTRELRETMSRLNQEAQTSAVLTERNRLASEIHDSLQQGLTAIMLQLDAVKKTWHRPEEARRYLAMARNMAGFSHAEVQSAVCDLRSPLLRDTNLGTALEGLADGLSAGGSQQVQVAVTGAMRPLASSVEHHLLRISQEAIVNAIKHGHAGHIFVTLDYAEHGLRLCIKDDGQGLVPEKALDVAKDGHFGLEGIRARAQKIGAELEVVSQPGQGASVVVTFPLAAAGNPGQPGPLPRDNGSLAGSQ